MGEKCRKRECESKEKARGNEREEWLQEENARPRNGERKWVKK